MFNLQITGKKMNTPEPKKKQSLSVIVKQIQKITSNTSTKHKDTNNRSQIQKKKVEVMQVKKKVQPTQEKKENAKIVEDRIMKEEIKKQQIMIQNKMEVMEAEVKKLPIITEITVRYNHYKEKFNCLDNVLSFAPIQEKYSFGDVFKGKFLPILKIFKGVDEIQPLTTGKAIQYSWLVEENKQYKLEIQEDEEEESKFQNKPYKAPVQEKKCSFKKNSRIEELTNEMKQMGIDELGKARHKQLLEQRDLEDILFS